MQPVLYSHPDFYIVNKPPNLGFHQEEGEAGFFQLLQQQMPSETLFPVHRLDKITSGLMIVARNKESARRFGELFENHHIEKYYLALSNHKPLKKQGLIKGDMERSRRGQWKLTRTLNNPAITRFVSISLEPGLRAFLLRPYSGKTHQIRVAMKSLGAPILGDSLYGGSSADRAYLHAYGLRFQWLGEDYHYRCLPTDGTHFSATTTQSLLQEQWDCPWNLD